jgi:diguanylate cyclase (GGDEF)-like protein
MVVDAARQKWAARRLRRSRPVPRPKSSQKATIARVALFLPLAVVGVILLCAATGFTATRISKGQVEAEQRAALQQALDEFHVQFAGVEAPDDWQLRQIARRSRLADLRFDAHPVGEVGRTVQSLHDGRGRIVGWFSWAGDRGFVAAMDRLWGLLALLGAILGMSALIATQAGRHVLRSLNRNAEDVRKLTTEDQLTGLPNRHVLLQELDEALAGRRGGLIVLALVDIDGFREINDTLGRSSGDALLGSIAEHLKAGLPPGAIFGRFEEDEFAVIVASDDPGIEGRLIEALRTSLLRPFFMDRMWQITASIGTARAPDHGADAEELVRRAGLALRAAKRSGRGNARRFEPQIETDHAERRFLLQELQSAIAMQAFEIKYQPIVAADGGVMVGVEALLRWQHPTRGPIAPSVFIPLAEQSGLMSQLGEIVLRRALSDGARWPTLSVAVNLSPLQIRDLWLVDLVANIIKETGIDPSRVVLEVTEGVLIDNLQEAQARLEALRGLGVRLALDDFGIGYSSLNYLQKFPFDRLKIDRSFVASLGASGNTGAIIQSIVTLGHALGMKVLAEGVERDEQRVLLRLAGCDEMQGYLFAKPGDAVDIDRALAHATRFASA